MNTLNIDPGNQRSAWVVYDTEKKLPIIFGIDENEQLRSIIKSGHFINCEQLAIEMVAGYGMVAGKELFETAFWTGRFFDSWPEGKAFLVYRKDVKLHLCDSTRGVNDAAIRLALMDRYGGKERAMGKKANPGPLFGVKEDIWAALAVAVTHCEGGCK